MHFTSARGSFVVALSALICGAGPLSSQLGSPAMVMYAQPPTPPTPDERSARPAETPPLSSISLRLHAVSLESALEAIARRAGLQLTYSDAVLLHPKRISAQVSSIPANEAFALVLDGTGLQAVQSAARRIIIVQGTTATPAPLSARDALQGTLTGRVTDAVSGDPLSGAQVVVGETGRGTLTAADGTFRITGVPAGAHRVRVSRLGYAEATATVTLTSGQSTTLNLELAPQAVALEGIVAVGYGTQRRRDITGSVGSVRAEELERSPQATVAQALQGRVAGVQVTQNSAAPGGGFSIRIRGSGSLSSNNEPLYVVDGLPINSDNATPLGSGAVAGRLPPSSLSFLNPDDVESIEVLKDASATAIYGARGSNGVVLITTKKGRAGRTLMELESSYGIQETAKRYDLLNAQEYGEFANALYRDRGLSVQPFPDPASLGAGTDWQDLILRTAPVMQHNLTLRGGVGETRFALAGGYTDEQGVIRRTGFQRYSFRGNLDHRVNSRLTVGSNFSGTRTNTAFGNAAEGNAGVNASAIQSAMIAWPFMPVRGEDGRYLYMDADVPSNLARLGWSAGANYENPVSAINEYSDELEQDRVLGNAFAEYLLLEGLSLRLNGGVDALHSTRNAYITRNTRKAGSGINGLAQTGTIGRSNYLGEAIARYVRRFGDQHNIDFTTGFTYESRNGSGRGMTNSGFATDHLGHHGIETGTVQGGPRISQGSSSSTLKSYIGRVNYDLAGRYLVTLTGRYDGSSKFGAGNKWGFFPSAALGWRISEEPFLSGANWLSDLKLRASYGVTGNQEIGDYQSLARLGSDEYSIGGGRTIGFFPVSVANPDLRWERSRMLNTGLDLAVLDNRVSVIFDVYRRITDDLLYRVPLPVEVGFRSVLMNAGSIENRGVELALSADVLDRSDFGWRASANISANRNEVLDIGGEATQFFGGDLTTGGGIDVGLKSGNLVREGLPLGVFYGYKVEGIFRDQAEVDSYVGPNGKPIMPGALPGQAKYVDVNGDGKITADDRTVLGNPEPDFLLGFTNDFSWKGLSLYTFLQGTFGNEIHNFMLSQIAAEELDLVGNLYGPRYRDRWTPDNPDARWPRLSVPAGQGYRGPGDIKDLYISDGSYLRLKTVTLSYDVPEVLAGRTLGGARSAQLFVNAQNLITWAKYPGIDPDVNSRASNVNRGIDFGAYPLARSYRIGVRLGL